MTNEENQNKFSVGPASDLNSNADDDESSSTLDDNLEARCSPHKMGIYEDDLKTHKPMSNMFSKFSHYNGGIEPTSEEAQPLNENQEESKSPGCMEKRCPCLKKSRKSGSSKLGVILGVFLPCLQNIFGVILFLRMTWIVGVAGIFQSTIIILICCTTTFLTALSMSAIATNGKVPAGGSYFMISRSIGPEFGGAVGILFYFGTTVASSMYIVGAVEVFLKYVCPSASIFGDPEEISSLFNNTRVYGSILLFLMMCCVFVGIKFVSKFATVSLAAVLISILCIYIGVFTLTVDNSPNVCVMGERLIAQSKYMINGTQHCYKNESSPLFNLYCEDSTSEECNFYNDNEIKLVPALPGLTSNKFLENIWNSSYRVLGESYVDNGKKPEQKFGQESNYADITSSFMLLLAIYFPSVTGIMAGSNRSGDLANPQVSIPRGTLMAIIMTSIVYITAPFLFGAVADGRVLRDKYGESFGGGMLVSKIGWPHFWVILIGSLLSTIGAGLQSLTGAPRLLQAIAQDNVIPILNVFRYTTKRGEPLYAQFLTYGISQLGILIASIDSITPLVTMFFLMCYGFVNLATALNSLIKEPNWRPRFRYYHWSLSLLGLGLCISLMFISSWYYALIAIAIAGGIYKYIEIKGASKEWGDATRGLQFTTAKRAILKLGDKEIHTKNWRPQILIYLPLNDDMTFRHKRVLDLVYQMKAGKGLTLVTAILEGDLFDRKQDVLTVKHNLNEIMHDKDIKGLAEVLVAKDVCEGMKNMAQCAGLGNLKHNTILVSFPETWRNDITKQVDTVKLNQFITLLRAAQAGDLAVMVPKNIDQFPQAKDRLSGTVDLWCIVHDGGLLMLISYLLLKNKTWSRCKLRIFLVATDTVNTSDLKKAMASFIFDLRIDAEVDVVEMAQTDISAYTTDKSLSAEDRQQMIEDMNLKTVANRNDMQTILDRLSRKNSDAVVIKDVPNLTVTECLTDKNLKDIDSDVIEGRTDDIMNIAPEARAEVDVLSSPVTKSGNSSVTFASGPGPAALAKEAANYERDNNRRMNEFTFSPSNLRDQLLNLTENNDIVSQKNKRKMHSAQNLNKLIHQRSSDASLVVINLPGPSRTLGSEYNYMDYVETLTKGLRRILLVRGSGREVITALSE